MNILLIEDKHSRAAHVLDALAGWNYETEWSVTGMDAIERVRRRSFDLILMDTFLPDIRGVQLIPEIKKFQPEAGVVTMTDDNTRELELQIRKQGIIYYMVEPFSVRDLKRILDHISMKRREQGNHK